MRSVALGALHFVLVLLVTAPLHAQARGVVQGRVRSEAGGAPLAGAEVMVSGAGATVTAGAGGKYRVEAAAGRRVVRARHVGYLPFEMEVVVPAGREMELDIDLRPAPPVVLEPVRVRAGGGDPLADSVPARAAQLSLAAARALQSTPGLAELGLADAARGVPGQEPVDPSDVLYVRGASTDMKLVYLDGAPVYAPFPLGGLLDPFTPGLLRSADVYLGGAPARYDGGLSYVLDLTTRGVRVDRPHSSGAVDLLSARAMLELPLGERAGVLVAGRSVHGLGTDPLARTPLPYGYQEGLVRGDLGVGEGVLSLTAFRNGESVWLHGGGSPDSTIRWGNSAASLRYRGRLGGQAAELTAALGDFDARLPVGGAQPMAVHGYARRARLAADLRHQADHLSIRYGASFDRQRQGYHAGAAGWSGAAEATADAAGVYADLGWQPLPRLRLRGGVRADHFSLQPGLVLAPRLAATWLASERAALTLAAGRYHQYLRPPETALRRDSAATPAPPLALGRATHLALTLDQELAEGVRFGVEGFFKSFQGIPGEQAAVANASGVDVWVRRTAAGWNGWAGYSLAWVWSLPDRDQNTRFAGRHLLSSGLQAPLGDRGRLDLGFVYGAGLPYATIPLAASEFHSGDVASSSPATRLQSSAGSPPLLPEPTRPYLRIDLGASRTWTGRWGGAATEFTPYVRLLNTLGQRDALFYRFDRRRDPEPRALVVLPTVPVLGLEWTF